MQDLVGEIVAERAHHSVHDLQPPGGATYNIHAYICGLNDMVSANRERLKGLGWERKQIVFERYD